MIIFAIILVLSFSWADSLAAKVPGDMASGFELVCPRSVVVRQNILDVPDGWGIENLSDGKARKLRGAYLYSGHPKEMVRLREGRVRVDAGGAQRILEFDSLTGRKNGIYILCGYESTEIGLIREILPAPDRCVLIHEGRQPETLGIRVRCR